MVFKWERAYETERIRKKQSLDSGASCDTELYNDKSRSNSPSEQDRQQEGFGNASVLVKNYNKSYSQNNAFLNSVNPYSAASSSSTSTPYDPQLSPDFNYKLVKKLGTTTYNIIIFKYE